MRRRHGFTLVEMLVAFALILFIMVILTEAFGSALRAFRDLKAVGDLEEKLRTAANVVRRDLAADHFEGKRRLSDNPKSWSLAWPAREGFFRVHQRSPRSGWEAAEGTDSDQLSSQRSALWALHFTVKLRGNERNEFFLAQVPAAFPSIRTSFFNHPIDAKFQETPTLFQSQWAEVAYFLEPNDTASAGIPLFSLYRTQYVAVADNRSLNNAQMRDAPAEISCQQDPVTTYLHFNTPADLATPSFKYPIWYEGNQRTVARRRFNPDSPRPEGATILATDVISFEVQAVTDQAPEPRAVAFDTGGNMFDNSVVPPRLHVIRALQITLRVRDPKTQLARQLTLVQEM